MLYGCITGVQPTVHGLELDNSDASSINNVVLTRRVVLDHGIKKITNYSSERTVDVTSISSFGKEHEIANVDCIVAGLRNALKDSTIISPVEFWETVGADKDTINLTSLFDESYSYVANVLDLDFVVAAYHQKFDVQSGFIDYIVAGVIIDVNKIIAAAITVDMKNKRVIDAIEVDADHRKGVGHTMFVIPFTMIEYPEENPCLMAGRHAAEAIARSLAMDKAPRIAVVAAKTNPYFSMSAPQPAAMPPLTPPLPPP
jgi:hypothetical protein